MEWLRNFEKDVVSVPTPLKPLCWLLQVKNYYHLNLHAIYTTIKLDLSKSMIQDTIYCGGKTISFFNYLQPWHQGINL